MPRPSLADWIAALPDFLVAGTALLTWIDPAIVGIEKVHYFVLLMLFEFVVVHSAGFMGAVAFAKESRTERSLALLGFGVFYTIFVAAISFAFHKWWPLVAFWMLVVNRLAGVIVGQVPDDEATALVRNGWAAGVAFYLITVFATIFIPIPRLGVSDQVIAAQHFTGYGLWVEQPWRVLAMAMLYFGLQGWSTLNAHRWVRRAKAGAAG